MRCTHGVHAFPHIGQAVLSHGGGGRPGLPCAAHVSPRSYEAVRSWIVTQDGCLKSTWFGGITLTVSRVGVRDGQT